MGRAVSLGKRGEEEWGQLQGALLLEDRRGVALVISESREVRDEIRRRLTDEAPELVRIQPGPDVLYEIYDFAKRAKRGDEAPLPVAWVEAETEDPVELLARWQPALFSLNFKRELISAEGPVFLVMAGPKALLERYQGAADIRSVTSPICILGEETEPIVEASGPITWLHLSDIHVRDSLWQQDLVLKALVRDLPGLLKESEIRPELVFLTGDIAYRGVKREYEAAQRFLLELMKALELDAREHLFLVPGNHDVDREAIRRMVRNDQERLLAIGDNDRFRAEVGELLGDPQDLGAYGSRLQAFCDFTSRLLGPARAVNADRPWRTDVRERGGLKVGIARLCSAWACGPDEDRKGRIVLGERQVREAAEEIADASLRVAMLHHPLGWLHDAEERVITELLWDRFHLVLHGHVHEAGLHLVTTMSQRCVISAAGAAYTGGRWPKGFQAGRWDPATGKLDLRFFAYTDRNGGFWHPDSGVQKGSKDGWVSLPLLVETVSEAGDRPLADEALAARIARAARSVYGHMNLIGVPADAAPRTRSGLLDVFVPLEFETEERGGEAAQDNQRPGLLALEKLLFSSSKQAPRVVVLGDPGSGKTTLTRYLALRCEEQEPPVAPLLLALRDWLREPDRPGLLEFLAADITRRLSVPVTPETLERLCAEGRALLLIDGFDEVVNADQRAWVRDAVAGLAGRFPRLPIVATSRVLGYDACPLDRRVFEHLRLAPFSDPQLEAFVTRWTEANEPDPEERDRQRRDLLSALEAEPRAKELARNPLFATLIALISRYEARLPGERAQLYELLVRMLLETRPGAKGEAFPDPRLDEGRQRAVLERLALRMQEGRGKGDKGENIILARPELERLLVELLGERELAGEPRAVRETVARRWVDWLAARTGLLVEQSPGVFGFLHLSVLEYLAGRALLEREGAKGDEAVAELVAERHRAQHWRETLLLMLGKEARRRALVERVAERLLGLVEGEAERDPYARWFTATFLLAMLREELDLPPEQRERVLTRAAAATLDIIPTFWEHARRLLCDVLRFGRRHGREVEASLRRRLERETGGVLLGTVALLPRQEVLWEPPGPLGRRPDVGLVLVSLLTLWPGDLWGRAATRLASPMTVLAWAATMALNLGIPRAVAALCGNWVRGSAGLSLTLLRRADWVAEADTNQVKALVEKRQGVPLKLDWSPLGSSVWIAPCMIRRVPHSFTKPYAGTVYGYKAAYYFLIGSASDFVKGFATNFVPCLAREFVRYVGDSSFPAVVDDIVEYYEFDYTPDAARLVVRDIGTDFAYYAESDVVQSLVRELAVTVTISRHTVTSESWKGDQIPSGSTLSPWKVLQQADERAQTLDGLDSLLLQLAAEAHAGLLPLLDPDDPDAQSKAALLATLRVQNYWLYLFLDPLIAYTQSKHNPLPPEHHALLLALGLAQFQTTWRWPWGEHWRSWFTSPPPEHWLPAFFWHQCQAVATRDPAATEASLKAAEVALDRADWPELAAELRAHMLIPTPMEILRQFDWGTDPDTPPTDAGSKT